MSRLTGAGPVLRNLHKWAGGGASRCPPTSDVRCCSKKRKSERTQERKTQEKVFEISSKIILKLLAHFLLWSILRSPDLKIGHRRLNIAKYVISSERCHCLRNFYRQEATARNNPYLLSYSFHNMPSEVT